MNQDRELNPHHVTIPAASGIASLGIASSTACAVASNSGEIRSFDSIDTVDTESGRKAAFAVENAMSAKKSAAQSNDMNRENQAQKDLHAAEDNEKAAKARLH